MRVLDNISKRLAHKFKFGYHEFDDMKQQAAIFAIEGLERYDNTRPLENFLWTHVRNRLFNYKRNNFQRPDKPCLSCEFYDSNYNCSSNQCSKYLDKAECELFKSWSVRNETKKNIMQPSYIDNTMDNMFFSNVFDEWIQNKEIIDFLDKNIHTDFREYYIKLKHGEKVSKQDMIKLKKHIVSIMEKNKWQIQDLKNEDN